MTAVARRRLASTGPGALAVLSGLRAQGAAPQPRGHALGRTLATGVWLVATLVEVAALAIWLARGAPDLPLSFASHPIVVLSLTAASLLTLSVGTFLARRLPGNLVGWVMMLSGLALLPILPSALMVRDALEVVRPVPALTVGVAWVMSTVSTPLAIGTFSIVLILFPDGRPSSPRWARLLLVPVAGIALVSIGAAFDRSMVWYPMLAGPMSGVIDPGLMGLARAIGSVAMVAGVGIAAASLVDRYRDANDLLRRQIRWVVLDGSLTVLMVAPLLIGRYLLRPADGMGELIVTLATVGAATFPIVVAIAITRADLFDIDVIISRTLVYLPLTAILAGMYAALVALLQRVFVALTGDTSDAVIVMTTLVLAAAFTPVRQTLDGFVERHFRAPRAGAGQGTPEAVSDPGAPAIDAETLLALLASHVERLEAVEARLLHLEHRPQTQRSASRKRRTSSPAASTRTEVPAPMA